LADRFDVRLFRNTFIFDVMRNFCEAQLGNAKAQ
jgi:hypothetical protein